MDMLCMTKKWLVCMICFCISSIVLAQQQSITYFAKDKPVVDILQDLETISGYHFSYNSKIIDATKKASIAATNTQFELCLSKILGNSYEYKIVGNQVIITEKKLLPPTKLTSSDSKKEKLILVYDTIPVYDTIREFVTHTDTINVIDTLQHIETITLQRYETNYLHTQNICSTISGTTGLIITTPYFYKGNEYSKALQDIHQSSIGFDIQFNYTYKRNNLLLQSGVNFYDFRVENSFATSYFTDDEMQTYTDTLWFWDYNEKFTYYKYKNGDSVAVNVLDSIYTYTLQSHPKKIEHINNKISTISWQYFSIPIGIGRHFNISNTFAAEPMLLINTMFLAYCRGEIANKQMTETTSIKELMRRVTFSATLSCNILYSIEKQYSVSVRPFCIIAPGIYKESSSGFQGLFAGYGVEWGFSYTIPHE